MTLTRDAILKALEGVTVDALVTKVHADIMATDIERELLDAGLEISPIKNSLKELREWASTVSQFMAEDKSNDWREEIAQLEVIEGRLDA